ncbi:MAG: Ig-like domain-containing protein, partial [Marinoscillum sp.]
IIIKSGGSLTLGEVWGGIGYNAKAVLTVETGGEMSFGQHAWIGFLEGAEGTVNIHGGTVNVAQMTGLGWEGGIGIVNIRDGLFDLANINATDLKSIGEGSYIDISGGGVMTINGNRLAHTDENDAEQPDQIAAFAEEGRITALGGNADLIYWYNEEADETFVVAPAIVESTFPLDLDTDVSRDADILIVFSKEMDATSVEANLTVSPAIDNQELVWSETGDTLSIKGDLADGVTYAVSVSTDAVDLFGYQLAYDESLSFTVEGEIAILLKTEPSERVTLFPNPTQDYFSFGSVAEEVKVFSMSGQLILKKSNVMSVSVDGLNPGQYFVKAQVQGQEITRRLIIKN